jgi:hypothetical protein
VSIGESSETNTTEGLVIFLDNLSKRLIELLEFASNISYSISSPLDLDELEERFDEVVFEEKSDAGVSEAIAKEFSVSIIVACGLTYLYGKKIESKEQLEDFLSNLFWIDVDTMYGIECILTPVAHTKNQTKIFERDAKPGREPDF